MYKIGEKYRSKNGLIGTVEDIRGVKRLVVRREGDDRILQTIRLEDIDLKKFERMEE